MEEEEGVPVEDKTIEGEEGEKYVYVDEKTKKRQEEGEELIVND